MVVGDLITGGTVTLRYGIRHMACLSALWTLPQMACACISDGEYFGLRLELVIFLVITLATTLLTGALFFVTKSLVPRASRCLPCAVSALLLGIALALLGFAAPAFAEVFASFGTDLPAATLAVLRYRKVLWLPLLVSLALWWGLRSNPACVRYCLPGLAIEVLLLSAVLTALYSPIFRLGASCA